MSASTRALRVGVLLGGNLVEERVFRDPGPITIGQSLRCRLSVPVDGMPHAHVLFVRQGGQTLLHAAAGMTGRIVHAGAPATDVHGAATIPVTRGARGKLTIGEATILFQELAAPPIAPRPRLPASVRGTFADRVDRRLATIVGASIVVHVAIGAWAWATDREVRGPFEAAAVGEYHHPTHETVDLAIADPIVAPPDAPALPGAATPAAPARQTPAPIVPGPRAQRPPAAVPTVDDALRLATIMTGGDETPRGTPSDLRHRQPGSDLDDQIDDIRDGARRVEVGNRDVGFRERPREGIGTGPARQLDAPAQLAPQAPRTETAPAGRITLRPTQRGPAGTTLTVDALLAKINAVYMRGLQRCYKAGLAGDPSLAGKITVAFTVDARGKVVDGEARGLATEVDACVTGQLATWRFPVPKDADGEPTDVDFALALALVPGT